MSVYQDWQVGVTYSFDSVVPGILPTNYEQIKLMSMCNFDIAKIIEGPNAYSMWRRIYPHLNGVQDDPSSVEWLVFEDTFGGKITLANVWISASSVTPVEFVQQRIILTQTSDAQIAQVTAFLNAIQAKYTSERIYR